MSLTLEETREERAKKLTWVLGQPRNLAWFARNHLLPPLHPDEWADLETRAQLPAWDGSVPRRGASLYVTDATQSILSCAGDLNVACELLLDDTNIEVDRLGYVGPEALTPPSAEWLRWSAECEARG